MTICENAIMQYSKACIGLWMIDEHPFILAGIVIAAVGIYAVTVAVVCK